MSTYCGRQQRTRIVALCDREHWPQGPLTIKLFYHKPNADTASKESGGKGDVGRATGKDQQNDGDKGLHARRWG